MSLPLKKRPYRAGSTLPQKVARLERKVKRATPDLQTFEYTQTAQSTTTGYVEYWIDTLGTGLISNFSGDFIVESIKIRADCVNDGGLRNALRIDLVVPQEKMTAPTSAVLTGVQNFFDPKAYKTYWSCSLILNNGHPETVDDFQKKLGLVVKSDGSTVTRNRPFIVVRWWNASTASPSVDIAWQVICREK